MKKHALKLTTLVFVIIAAVVYYQQKSETNYSLQSMLPQYGISTPEQKRAFTDMLKRAAVIPEGKSFDDIFPARKNATELVGDILKLVQETQKTFVVRKGNQERWEVEATEWMKKNIPEIEDDLLNLGFMDEVDPRNQKPDAVCILGATYHRMADRLAFAKVKMSEGLVIPQLILLAGERYVTVGVDGTEDELMAIASKQGVDDIKKLTETNMMKAAYEVSGLADKMPVHIIDTPRGDLPRPTTQTTMLELLKYLATKPEIKHIVFVSNQPYVQYQRAIISAVLAAEKSRLTFEVIGSVVENPKEVQPLIEGLGSFLYAATPEILAKLNVMIEDAEMRASLEKLYAKNPSLYGVLAGVLKK